MADLNAKLKGEFIKAQADVKTLSKRPGNDDLLFLYAHFKQATDGDVSGSRPGLLDVKGRAKFDAWARLKPRCCVRKITHIAPSSPKPKPLSAVYTK